MKYKLRLEKMLVQSALTIFLVTSDIEHHNEDNEEHSPHGIDNMSPNAGKNVVELQINNAMVALNEFISQYGKIYQKGNKPPMRTVISGWLYQGRGGIVLEIFGSFSSTSTSVSDVFILPVSPPKIVRGSVTRAHMKITNKMLVNGSADVSLKAHAMLLRRKTTANNTT